MPAFASKTEMSVTAAASPLSTITSQLSTSDAPEDFDLWLLSFPHSASQFFSISASQYFAFSFSVFPQPLCISAFQHS